MRFKWGPFNHSKKEQCSPKEETPQGQLVLNRYLKDFYPKYQNQLVANYKAFSLFAGRFRQLEITLLISSTCKLQGRRSTITKEKQNANGKTNIKDVLLIIPQKQMLEYICNK